MHGSSVFEISADTDGEVIKSSRLALDGYKVGERLGGVIVTAVTRVDERNGSYS